MTPIAQMLHVARKDLRESSWPIAVYVALVAIGGAHAAGVWPAARLLEVPMFLVVIAGMVLVAMLVQSDSPGRVDAFWATRPLQPTAVLLAKMLTAIVVVLGLALVAQAFALSSFDLHGMALARRLPTAAIAYARWLVVAMVLAALTKDLKAFVVALVAVPLLVTNAIPSAVWRWLFADGGSADGGGNAGPGAAPLLVAWIGIAGCVALLFWFYHQRDRGRLARVAGAIAAACAVLIALGAPSIPPADAGPGVASRVGVEISMPPHAIDSADIRLDVRATGVPPGQRVTLREASAEVELSDGTLLTVLANPAIVELGFVRPTIANSVWLTTNRDSIFGMRLFLRPDSTQRIKLARGVKRIVVTGRVWAAQSRIAGSLPLVAGASLTSPGKRVTMQSWSHTGGHAEVHLGVLNLPVPGTRGLTIAGAASPVEYALVNDKRAGAAQLQPRGASNGPGWLVLPGDGVANSSLTLDTRILGSAPIASLDDRWFDDARVWVVDWLPLGSYPVRAELTLP